VGDYPKVGKGRCSGSHEFAVKKLGAGLARLECRRCDTVIIDLDATDDDNRTVTAPGLFRPKKPTIFSVLAEEKREAQEAGEERDPSTSGPRYAFGGTVRRR
jgi:hypothetical protein